MMIMMMMMLDVVVVVVVLMLLLSETTSVTHAQVPGFQCGTDADCGLCVVGELCCCDPTCVDNGDCCGSVEEYRQICEASAGGGGGGGSAPAAVDDFLSLLCPPNGDCNDLSADELLTLIGEIEQLINDEAEGGGGGGGLLPGADIPLGAPIDLAPPPPPPPPDLDERDCEAGAWAKPGTFNPGFQICSGCPPPNNWYRVGQCPPGAEREGDRTAYADPNVATYDAVKELGEAYKQLGGLARAHGDVVVWEGGGRRDPPWAGEPYAILPPPPPPPPLN
ncbi:hypothetical protein NFJ02_34g85530 [Pycnococcus provasolii]